MTPIPPRDIPRIPWREIEPIYIVGFYDGPLSGRCRWREIEGWYELINYPDAWTWPLYELRTPPADVLAELDRRSGLFHELVNDWANPGWRRSFTGARSTESQAEYKSLSEGWEPIDIDKVGERVGWFSMTPHFERARSWRYWERARL